MGGGIVIAAAADEEEEVCADVEVDPGSERCLSSSAAAYVGPRGIDTKRERERDRLIICTCGICTYITSLSLSLSLSLSFTLSLREGKFALKNRCGPVVDLATATTPATTPAKATKKNLNFGVEAILEFQIRFMSPAGCV